MRGPSGPATARAHRRPLSNFDEKLGVSTAPRTPKFEGRKGVEVKNRKKTLQKIPKTASIPQIGGNLIIQKSPNLRERGDFWSFLGPKMTQKDRKTASLPQKWPKNRKKEPILAYF